MKTCVLCDDQMPRTGRPSKTGEYFCSKEDCRRERDRRRAVRWRAEHPTPTLTLTDIRRKSPWMSEEELRQIYPERFGSEPVVDRWAKAY